MNEKELIITDDSNFINKKNYSDLNAINYDMAKLFAMSGYTIGEYSTYKYIKQINPGGFIWVDKNNIAIKHYYQWKPWKVNIQKKYLSKDLSILNKRIISKLINNANDRQIIIPLSAGMDSRFIASGLKNLNYKNVLCVSYGRKKNRDAIIARKIAKKLDYQWIYVPYTQDIYRKNFFSNKYKDFDTFSDYFTSIPFSSEFIMMKYLNEGNLISKKAIFVNGQSGDFISGGHIPKDMLGKVLTKNRRFERLIKSIVKEHFKHWHSLITPKNIDIIKLFINKELESIGGLPKNNLLDYAVFEYLEYMNRQTKYVVNGQRVYEFFGYDWRLPLWDNEYLDFWEKIPLEQKFNQKLYKETLINDNWGGVWKDIPLNPLFISPRWLIPVRNIAKSIYFFLGKEQWYDFERKYISYFMSPICHFAPWNYLDIINDKRRFFSSIAWYIEDYLNKKQLNWKGEDLIDNYKK